MAVISRGRGWMGEQKVNCCSHHSLVTEPGPCSSRWKQKYVEKGGCKSKATQSSWLSIALRNCEIRKGTRLNLKWIWTTWYKKNDENHVPPLAHTWPEASIGSTDYLLAWGEQKDYCNAWAWPPVQVMRKSGTHTNVMWRWGEVVRVG